MKRTYQKPVMEIDERVLMPQMICGSGGGGGGGLFGIFTMGGGASGGTAR